MTPPTCIWCGDELVGKRPHAEYCDSTCRANATRWRQDRAGEDAKPLRSAAPPPIQLIREEQEAAKAHWSMAVREGIIEVLRSGEFHADDLEPLGIPDEHRNIIGSQTAKLVNQKWMVECGRRKSTLPSRNGAKSNVYRLTEHGRKCIAGLGAGLDGRGTPSRASVESGESGIGAGSGEGVPTPQGPGGAIIGVPPCASTASPDCSTGDQGQARLSRGGPVDAVPGAAPSEPLPLFGESALERLQDVA